MIDRPRIAVILDENTSGDASRYEAAKGYFRGIGDAGGLPFGVPYLPEIVDVVLDGFDGLLSVGGRFAYPDDWYVAGTASEAPPSGRFAIEKALVEGYVRRGKPILGICAGMQMLACSQGCRLTPDLRATMPDALEHDRRGHLHPVTIADGSRLAVAIGHPSLMVNTFHREAVAELAGDVRASARAADGVIEAIEIASHPFAVGLQWHQELFAAADHPGNAIFKSFVEAAAGRGGGRS